TAGVHHAAEVESDHAGDPAEESEPDQHVERKLELRLADVIAVAEQPRVSPAEPAQVVEAGQVEPPAEAAALRQPQGDAGVQLGAADHTPGLGRVCLRIAEERVGAAT